MSKLASKTTPALLLGFVAGIVSGLFGVGGGIIVVPGLVLAIRIRPAMASGTSIATIVVSAAVGVSRFQGDGAVDWRAASLLFAGASIGAIAGGRVITNVPQSQLARMLSVLMMVSAIKIGLS
ncbi:hypothetical protein MNBD_ACTINO02-2272 [hydrothermal vent metagenome]|uniref:Membrane transporter protein n=1 Tax=hydrothermal vent metagenome TaxID=652676 RepID=A0A3B0SER2_9ZZZZ